MRIRRARALLCALPLLFATELLADVATKQEVQRLTGLSFSVFESVVRRSIISSDTPYGLKVRAVEADSPAARAGVHAGDLLMRWDDRPIKTVGEIHTWLLASEPGDAADLSISRRNLRASLLSRDPWLRLEATLELPAPHVRNSIGLTFTYVGSVLSRLSGGEPPPGLCIKHVVAGSPADRAGLQPGDILIAWDGRPVHSVFQVQFGIAIAAPGAEVPLTVWKLNRDVRFGPERWTVRETLLTLP